MAAWRSPRCGLRSSLAVAALLMAVPVGAQSADGLHLTATADAIYDSNPLRVGDTSRLYHDDVRFSPSGSASYGRSSGQIALTANGLIGSDVYQRNKNLSSERYSGGGAVTYHAGSRCQLGVTGNFSVRQSGIVEPGAIDIDPNSPVDDVGQVIDNVLTASTYGANASCGSPTGRLTFSGNYNHSSISNAAATRKFGDSDNDNYSGSIGLGIIRPGQLSLTGSYSTIAYPGRVAGSSMFIVPPQLLGAGVRSYHVGLTYSRPIGARLNGSIGASYLHSDSGGGVSGYSSPAYNVNLSYTPSQRFGLSLAGSRDVLPGTTTGAQYRVVDQILFNGSYRLGTRISFAANAAFIDNKYIGAFAVPGEPARGNDKTTTLGASVSYSPRRLIDLTLNVTQSIRHSDQAIFNYDSTQAGISLVVKI